MHRPTPRSLARIATLLAPLLFASSAHAQTFSNPEPIAIRDNNTATPYPSRITVSGVSGPVGSISVTLFNANHTYVGDLEIGLLGPDGTLYPILSDCGGVGDLLGHYTFVVGREAAPIPADSGLSIAPGSYAPSVCGPGLGLPFVDGPRGNMTDLIGSTNLNGTWSLYIADDFTTDFGTINNGWSITFEPPTTRAYTRNAIMYQGRLESADAPAQQEFIGRFRVFDAPTGGSIIGAPVAARIVPTDGLFSVPLDFGLPTPFDGNPRWLDIEINGVPILPRQPLATTAYALHSQSASLASSAVDASNATNASTVPWSGITNVPTNIADLRLAPATLANSALINGSLGLGAQPLASSRLHAAQPSLGATDWHIELTNNTIPAFRGGIRVNNSGFLDITNNATSAVGFFARLNSTGAWTVASDARLKTDVRPATGMLDTAMKLRPVFFHWLNEDAGQEDFGLIAQEVQGVLPRLVTGDESKDTLTVNYSQLSVVAIAAIQELKAQHEAEMAATSALINARDEAQQRQIDTLRAESDDLRTQLQAQQQQINALAQLLEASAATADKK